MNTYIEKPELFIDYTQHIEQSVGATYTFEDLIEIPDQSRNIFGLHPSGAPTRVVYGTSGGKFSMNFNTPIPARFINNINYIALFGHNLASQGTYILLTAIDTDGTTYNIGIVDELNSGAYFDETDVVSYQMAYDNFSIIGLSPSIPTDKKIVGFAFQFNSSSEIFMDGELTLDIASISIGRKYSFPHSVDLSSSVGFVHDGIDIKETVTGKNLYQTKWTHQPNHGKFVPFQLYHPNTDWADDKLLDMAKRSGRANFNFQVSHLSDTELIPDFKLPHDTVGLDIENGHTGLFDDAEGDGIIANHDSLGALLNTFTNGGQMPMMLCANTEKTHTNGWVKTDEFYIVRNDDDGFEFKPIAPDLYNINFKFVETW